MTPLTHPDGRPLGRRMERRVRREMARGAVFFSFDPECRLEAGRLIWIGESRSSGWEAPEREGLLLRRLEGWRGEAGCFLLRGEFYCRCETFAFDTVDPGNARIVRRTLKLKRPLLRERELAAFLERERLRAEGIAPTPGWKIAAGWCREQLGVAVALLSIPVMAAGTLCSAISTRTVEGTLEGFQERDGKHYPCYSYRLPDGRRMRTADDDVSLEESVAPEEARRLLRRKHPRPVTVRYRRRAPEQSRCQYL